MLTGSAGKQGYSVNTVAWGTIRRSSAAANSLSAVRRMPGQPHERAVVLFRFAPGLLESVRIDRTLDDLRQHIENDQAYQSIALDAGPKSRGAITGVVFSADGARLASASTDGVMRVHELADDNKFKRARRKREEQLKPKCATSQRLISDTSAEESESIGTNDDPTYS